MCPQSVQLKLPVIAIVGRPNVGKSTLVNRMVGHRQAIVDDQPGVTRDRGYYKAEWLGKPFYVVDTGGFIPDATQTLDPVTIRRANRQDQQLSLGAFDALVNEQVNLALAEADIVVLLVDGQAGLVPQDEQLASMLRSHPACQKKPLLLVVNKLDTAEDQLLSQEFYALGLGEPLGVSAMHGTVGVGDLLDRLTGLFPDSLANCPEDESADHPPDHEAEDTPEPEAAEPVPIRLALVGRPNVGKSSILNALLKAPRAMVSDIAGTTRDAIESELVYENQTFILVDTAGIRKKARVDYGIELFSVDRALRMLKSADVAVLVLDAIAGVTDQDKKIAETIVTEGRGLVLVVNKWDLLSAKSPKSADVFKKKLYADMPHAAFAPVVFVSATSGQRVHKILETVVTVAQNHRRRFKTSLVNPVFLEAFRLNPPPTLKNKTLKLLYVTQVSVAPPTFVLFLNDANLLKDSYRRYLERKLRENFELSGTPVVFIARTRLREPKR